MATIRILSVKEPNDKIFKHRIRIRQGIWIAFRTKEDMNAWEQAGGRF